LPSDPSLRQEFVSAFCDSKIPIRLVVKYSLANEKFLNAISDSRQIKSLSIYYSGAAKIFSNRELIDNNTIDLKLRFPALKELTVFIDEDYSQEKQLKFLLSLPPTKVKLLEVDEVGARFLLKNQNRMRHEISVGLEDSVPDKLRKKLKGVFPKPVVLISG